MTPATAQERHAIAGHHRVGEPERITEQEQVEEPLELLIVAEQHRIQGRGRHREGHQPPDRTE
jgi:hypothetical protein